MELKLSYRSLIQVISVVLLFFISWTISGWNTYNADIENYEIRYLLVSNDDLLDPNYGISLAFLYLNRLGLDFFHARLIVYGVFYAILSLFFLRVSTNAFVVFVMYLLLQLVRDTVELKNFMALVTTLLAFHTLSRRTVKYKVLALLLFLCAASFHIAYYLYFFVFVLLLLPYKRKLPMTLFYMVALVLSFLVKTALFFLSSLSSDEFLEERIEGLSSYTGNGAIIVASIVVAGTLFVFRYFFSKVTADDVADDIWINGQSYRDYSLFMYNLNSLGVILLIFSSINFSFIGRLYAVVIVLNFIYFINCFSVKILKPTGKMLILFMLFFIAVLSVFSMAEMHYVDVFSNNLLF